MKLRSVLILFTLLAASAGLVNFYWEKTMMADCPYKEDEGEPELRDISHVALDMEYVWNPKRHIAVKRTAIPFPWQDLKRTNFQVRIDNIIVKERESLQGLLTSNSIFQGMEYYTSHYSYSFGRATINLHRFGKHFQHNGERFILTTSISTSDLALTTDKCFAFLTYSDDPRAPHQNMDKYEVSQGSSIHSFYLDQAKRSAPYPVYAPSESIWGSSFTIRDTIFAAPAVVASGEYAWACQDGYLIRRVPLPLPEEKLLAAQDILVDGDLHPKHRVAILEEPDWYKCFTYTKSLFDPKTGEITDHYFEHIRSYFGEADPLIHVTLRYHIGDQPEDKPRFFLGYYQEAIDIYVPPKELEELFSHAYLLDKALRSFPHPKVK